MGQAFFVTGTDTDSGKTTTCVALLHAARGQGWSTAAVKPVASGCKATPDGLRNADALALWAECTLPLSYVFLNPVALEPGVAPHLAAARAGVHLDIAELTARVRQVLDLDADLTLVEGAGGWRVPLNDAADIADLAVALALPVILVVGVRLGCLNHALLSAQAIVQDGLRLAGWVGCVLAEQTAELAGMLATLKQRLPAPCLGVLPWVPQPGPGQGHHLDLLGLLRTGAEAGKDGRC